MSNDKKDKLKSALLEHAKEKYENETEETKEFLKEKGITIEKAVEMYPIPSFKKDNKTFRKTCYIADFSYYDNELGKVIVEDTKGFSNDVYKLKKKMFEYKYTDLTIREIKRR